MIRDLGVTGRQRLHTESPLLDHIREVAREQAANEANVSPAAAQSLGQ